MKESSRSEAQKRVDDIVAFQSELSRLEADAIVALQPEQRRVIDEHHRGLLARFGETFDIDPDTRAKQLSLGMRITSFLGALAAAASVFFLFYNFWGYFSETAQVAVLVAAAVGTLMLTAWIQGRDTTGYFTKLAALVAFACFVLNIAMIGQIFNITPSDKALVPWAALAFLLAYSCDLRLLLVAGILCVIAFVSARVGSWGGMYWMHFGERPENFFPVAVLIFSFPQWVDHQRFAGFAPIYRVFGMLALFLPMLVLAHWGRGSYFELEPAVIEGFYQLLGFLGTGLAIWLGAKRHWPEVVNTGVTLFVIFLYTKFYDWWWEIMPKYLFFLVVALISVALLLALRRLRGRALVGGKGSV